jgi:hypothetical protein
MSFLNLEQLPFEGMSYEFHDEKQGAPISLASDFWPLISRFLILTSSLLLLA